MKIYNNLSIVRTGIFVALLSWYFFLIIQISVRPTLQYFLSFDMNYELVRICYVQTTLHKAQVWFSVSVRLLSIGTWGTGPRRRRDTAFGCLNAKCLSLIRQKLLVGNSDKCVPIIKSALSCSDVRWGIRNLMQPPMTDCF